MRINSNLMTFRCIPVSISLSDGLVTQAIFLLHTALRIHISQSTADILVQAGSFELKERGDIEMKVTCQHFCVCVF